MSFLTASGKVPKGLYGSGLIRKKLEILLIKDMYGLLKEENAEEASQDLITKSAFAEMDQVFKL